MNDWRSTGATVSSSSPRFGRTCRQQGSLASDEPASCFAWACFVVSHEPASWFPMSLLRGSHEQASWFRMSLHRGFACFLFPSYSLPSPFFLLFNRVGGQGRKAVKASPRPSVGTRKTKKCMRSPIFFADSLFSLDLMLYLCTRISEELPKQRLKYWIIFSR